jgi:hypothetical protein
MTFRCTRSRSRLPGGVAERGVGTLAASGVHDVDGAPEQGHGPGRPWPKEQAALITKW